MKLFPTNVKAIKGEVHLLRERCKGCGFCVTYCPMKVLEISEDFNIHGYHYPTVKNADACINCGLCEMLCPDFAIWSRVKEEKQVLEL